MRWVQEAKELTLSVLEDVSRGLSTRAPTRRLEVLKHRGGSTSPSASTRPREFVLGGTLGRRLLILGLRFGALEVHFDMLL